MTSINLFRTTLLFTLYCSFLVTSTKGLPSIDDFFPKGVSLYGGTLLKLYGSNFLNPDIASYGAVQ